MSLLVPRSEWGSTYDYARRHLSRPAPVAKVETCLHTTVTVAPDVLPPYGDEREAMRLLERIGTQRFGSGLSYNAVAFPSGNAYDGQPLNNKATHSEYQRWNWDRASIALCGNYDKDRPTAAMLATVAAIQAEWLRDGVIQTVTLRGHYEVAAKACPGRYAIKRMDDIAAMARGLLKEDDMPTVKEIVEGFAAELGNLDSPLSKQLRNNVRIPTEAEILEQRPEMVEEIVHAVLARLPLGQVVDSADITRAVLDGLAARLQQ